MTNDAVIIANHFREFFTNKVEILSASMTPEAPHSPEWHPDPVVITPPGGRTCWKDTKIQKIEWA